MVIVYSTKHLTYVDEWRRLGEAVFFPPGSRLELINGEILEMAPIGFNHAGRINRLVKLLTKPIPDDVIPRLQNPSNSASFPSLNRILCC